MFVVLFEQCVIVKHMQSFSCHVLLPLLSHLQDSELSLMDAELALQMKIFEAACKLCEEDHLSKAVKKSRLLQCKRQETKLKQLQEAAFQLRLQHGRSSPLPAINIPPQGEGYLWNRWRFFINKSGTQISETRIEGMPIYQGYSPLVVLYVQFYL